jgi:hypothetical protein
MDSQKGLFISYSEAHHLVDIELVKLDPTWCNLRTGKDIVSKRLDIFSSFEELLSSILLVNSSVGEGGISYHRMIVLKIKSESDLPPIPFKFNHIWMEEQDFVFILKSYWKPLDSSRDQFMVF